MHYNSIKVSIFDNIYNSYSGKKKKNQQISKIVRLFKTLQTSVYLKPGLI